jgi:hypothetical protein
MDMLPAFRVVLGSFAVVALAACGARPAAPAAPAAAVRTAAAPPSCRQQYGIWKQGPARALVGNLDAADGRARSAAAAEDIPVLSAALKAAGAAAAALAAYPMPACADPRGYWGAMLARIRAAGDNAGSSSGLSGLLLAEAPLQAVPGLEAKLTAELKRTT